MFLKVNYQNVSSADNLQRADLDEDEHHHSHSENEDSERIGCPTPPKRSDENSSDSYCSVADEKSPEAITDAKTGRNTRKRPPTRDDHLAKYFAIQEKKMSLLEQKPDPPKAPSSPDLASEDSDWLLFFKSLLKQVEHVQGDDILRCRNDISSIILQYKKKILPACGKMPSSKSTEASTIDLTDDCSSGSKVSSTADSFGKHTKTIDPAADELDKSHNADYGFSTDHQDGINQIEVDGSNYDGYSQQIKKNGADDNSPVLSNDKVQPKLSSNSTRPQTQGDYLSGKTTARIHNSIGEEMNDPTTNHQRSASNVPKDPYTPFPTALPNDRQPHINPQNSGINNRYYDHEATPGGSQVPYHHPHQPVPRKYPTHTQENVAGVGMSHISNQQSSHGAHARDEWYRGPSLPPSYHSGYSQMQYPLTQTTINPSRAFTREAEQNYQQRSPRKSPSKQSRQHPYYIHHDQDRSYPNYDSGSPC